MKFVTLLMLVTQEYDFDLHSGLARGGQNVRYSRPATNVFQLKIQYTAMYSCLVCVS